MPTSQQYRLHGILAGGTWIGELEDTTPASNVELITAYAGGSITPSFRGAQGAKPDISFTTPQIKTILDACTDGDGISCKDYSGGNVDLFYRAADPFGANEAIGSSVHEVVRARRAMLVWTEISAKQGADATIQCRLIPTITGTDIPLLGIGSQTIAANVNVAEKYTLGPVEINGAGSFLDGVQGWSFAQSFSIEPTASDGDIYPSIVSLQRGDPILSIDMSDLGLWADHGVTGTALTAIQACLRKRNVDQAANYADASEVHIVFTANDNPAGFIYVDQSSGGVGDWASVGLKLALRRSAVGTTHPLAVATTSAIAVT